ncbi:hypothetical protein M0R45_037242 [Rubus argutus]|uniref:Uncharacterized protein n=1 Tax=Rubus argutus TaxID=59490 RepID=A0AAW1W1A9_RUBAR
MWLEHGGSNANYARECELQANLFETLRLQELLWKEKSRLRWLAEGDHLFANHADYSDTGLICRIIPSTVTDVENGPLMAIPSSKEIFLAVKNMDQDSAPGPDSFNGPFFYVLLANCW